MEPRKDPVPRASSESLLSTHSSVVVVGETGGENDQLNSLPDCCVTIDAAAALEIGILLFIVVQLATPHRLGLFARPPARLAGNECIQESSFENGYRTASHIFGWETGSAPWIGSQVVLDGRFSPRLYAGNRYRYRGRKITLNQKLPDADHPVDISSNSRVAL